MSKRIAGVPFIFPEPPDKCELCGKFDELRPYGKNGERICFTCAMRDKKTTDRQMGRKLFGLTDQELDEADAIDTQRNTRKEDQN